MRMERSSFILDVQRKQWLKMAASDTLLVLVGLIALTVFFVSMRLYSDLFVAKVFFSIVAVLTMHYALESVNVFRIIKNQFELGSRLDPLAMPLNEVAACAPFPLSVPAATQPLKFGYHINIYQGMRVQQAAYILFSLVALSVVPFSLSQVGLSVSALIIAALLNQFYSQLGLLAEGSVLDDDEVSEADVPDRLLQLC